MQFFKYQGTGNDFILIDNRDLKFNRNDTALVSKLCDRHFGIGADGLMLLQSKENYDFEMIYFNADGNEGSMCGNGGRCIVEFARLLGVVKDKAKFIAVDGEHEAVVKPGFVSLKMNDVTQVEVNDNFSFLNTGSPHYVAFVDDITKYNVFEEGRKVRYNNRFKDSGTNVNFIEQVNSDLFVRTYERGVEDETFSCGTGVTASAIIASVKGLSTDVNYCNIKTLGGDLKVKFTKVSDTFFKDVWLEGPATFVFKGEVDL